MKYSIILFILFISCQNRIEDPIELKQVANTIEVLSVDDDSSYILLEEQFIDSTRIGKAGHNKLELYKYRTKDSIYIKLLFFKKHKGEWKHRQTLLLPKDGILTCEPIVSDYTNDGNKDFSVISAVATRGANEVRHLFVYDASGDSLRSIINSEHYPNMRFNDQLKCIDAWLVYGGSTTAYLYIAGDSLKEFARVEAQDGLIVKEIGKDGAATVIYQDPDWPAIYVRFKNYKPLQIDETADSW